MDLTILDRLLIHSNAMSADYLREIRGWNSAVSGVPATSEGKCLPYVVGSNYNRDRYDALVLLGNYLYRCSDIIQRSIQRFISYTVSNGHQYEVVKRKYPLPGAGRATISPSKLNRLRGIVDWATENVFPNGWQAMQEETQLRHLREGCAFRQLFEVETGLTVRFVEPRRVRGPHDPSIWEGRGFDINGTVVPALDHRLGVLDTPDDHTVPLAYLLWTPVNTTVPDSPENYDVIVAKEMLHCKQGVDSTDPRGLPIFWNALKYVQRHEDTGMSSAALSKVRASYAVIRQYLAGTNFQNLVKVAGAHRETEEKRGGDILPGKEVDAKGFEYVFPDLNIDAGGFAELLSTIELAIGSYLDMPEWMITGRDAGGGSSGVVASEGPFDRRVKRTQAAMARDDIEILWRVIQRFEELSDEELIRWKSLVSITPVFPTVQTRDPLKESQRVIAELHAGLDSPQGACGQLRKDYDSVMEQVQEHNKNYPDQKIVSKWDPETQVQRNKGDNVRANRMSGSSNSGGSE